MVDLCCLGENEVCSKPIDPGPMIHHCCLSFPKNDATDSSSCNGSHYDVVLIGGGVPGFAFQELFAPSHHLSFHWNFTSVDSNNENDTKAISLLEPTNPISLKSIITRTSEPSQFDSVCNPQPQCDVVYVLKQNAKVVKLFLEESKFINKLYRMTAIEPKGITRWPRAGPMPDATDNFIKEYIAIPIRAQFVDSVHHAMESDNTIAKSLIVGFGQQICLPSTGSYARGNVASVL